jgi:hypothetical protein
MFYRRLRVAALEHALIRGGARPAPQRAWAPPNDRQIYRRNAIMKLGTQPDKKDHPK